jgi:hypothetical protein
VAAFAIQLSRLVDTSNENFVWAMPVSTTVRSTPSTKYSTQSNRAVAQYHDARISAVCMENAQTTLWAIDRDFSRDKHLNAVNPLL